MTSVRMEEGKKGEGGIDLAQSVNVVCDSMKLAWEAVCSVARGRDDPPSLTHLGGGALCGPLIKSQSRDSSELGAPLGLRWASWFALKHNDGV